MPKRRGDLSESQHILRAVVEVASFAALLPCNSSFIDKGNSMAVSLYFSADRPGLTYPCP